MVDGIKSECAAPGEPRLCPSSTADEGALLIGLVQEDGTVGIMGRLLQVDAAFLDTARKGREPEKRFRFASPCRKSDCREWGDGRCGVIDRVLTLIAPEGDVALLPCGIRG